ncbi:MAG: hypothetical protein LBS05_00120 [Tannerellaceae bacterium]|jgi:hypothetical protein|nr:hypothetical protein [Tannerellaceae bacterium]
MERLIIKARVEGVDFAPVITSEAGITTAVWTAQPVMLRDDEVTIVEGDPEETEVFSHENDAPEDYEVSGQGISATGSFIKASYAQMATLMGGKIPVDGEGDPLGMYLHSSKKKVLETAVRFRLKNGGSIILPYAKGSVQFNANVGYDGVLKHPFRFRALAQGAFETDLILA